MDMMEMFRRNMLGNQNGSGEGESNVSSIFDLIFPRSSKRPGAFGVDDTGGIINSQQEISGPLLNFWQTRLAKFQAILHKMFEEIKQKADELWQMLSQKNAGALSVDTMPLNARSAQMGSSAGGAVGYTDPFSAPSSGYSASASRGSSGHSR